MKIRLLLAVLLLGAGLAPWEAAAAQRRSTPRPPRRVAVLIGIDQYANSGAKLQGCATDVAMTRKMLLSRGYAPIVTLTNAQATGANIRKALATLARTSPEDYVYIHFSGFGNKDSSGSVLCPADYAPNRGGIPYSAWLAQIDAIPAVRKTAVIDCSFVPGPYTGKTRARYWTTAFAPRGFSRNPTGRRSFRAAEPPKTIIVSAAEKDAPAMETLINAGKNRKAWAGALTWAFLRSAQTANGKATLQHLQGGIDSRNAGRFSATASVRGFDLKKMLGLHKVKFDLGSVAAPLVGALTGGASLGLGTLVQAVLPKAGKDAQKIAALVQQATDKSTTVEEKIGALMSSAGINLGGQTPGTAPFVPEDSPQPGTVMDVQNGMVTMDQGLGAEFTEGSVVQGFSDSDPQPDFTLQVTSSDLNGSEAKLLSGEMPDPGDQVVLGQPAPPADSSRLVVEIKALDAGADHSSLVERLNAQEYLRVAAPGDIPDRFLLVSSNGGMMRARLVTLDTGLDESALAGGAEASEAGELVRQLQPALTSAYLLKRLAVVQNPGMQIQMALTVQKENGADVESGVQVGESVRFAITVDRPAFLTLINVGTDGTVNVLLPNRFMSGQQKASPGQAYQFPPAGSGLSVKVEPPGGQEMVMAIATGTPLDMSQFESTTVPNLGVRSLTRQGSRQLAARLRNLVVVQAAPGAGGESGGWGTTFAVFPVAQGGSF